MADEVEDEPIEEGSEDQPVKIDLDDELSQYTVKAVVDPPTEDEPSGESAFTPTPSNPAPVQQDVERNGKYYVRGPKKGQLKPGYVYTPKPSVEQSQPVITGDLIDGEMFILLVDLFFPMVISFLNNTFSKTEVDAEDLQLTEKQKRMFQPIADKVITKLAITGDPVALLFFGLAGVYGVNYMAQKQKSKKK